MIVSFGQFLKPFGRSLVEYMEAAVSRYGCFRELHQQVANGFFGVV